VIFWDSSAIIPLCLDEPLTATMRTILSRDREMAAWWGTPVECRSVFARLERERAPSIPPMRYAIQAFETISRIWLEIQPCERVRGRRSVSSRFTHCMLRTHSSWRLPSCGPTIRPMTTVSPVSIEACGRPPLRKDSW
jgi:hypothetical protein